MPIDKSPVSIDASKVTSAAQQIGALRQMLAMERDAFERRKLRHMSAHMLAKLESGALTFAATPAELAEWKALVQADE